MKRLPFKNKLWVIPVIAVLMSTSFFIIYDAEESDAAPPTVTLTDLSIGYAPKFTVSPWKVNEYNSITGVFTSGIGSTIVAFSNKWVGEQIPGITISAYGSSVQSNNPNINAVNNGDGTYSYYFRLSGTPTSTGTFDVRNQLYPPQIYNGMWFNFTIVDDFIGAASSSKSHSNSVQYGGEKTYASSAIEFKGASWKPGEERWNFEYRMAGIGYAEGGSGILYAYISLNATENKSNIIFWPTPPDPRYIGSTPASSTGTNYSGVANAVIGLALTANPAASLIWSTANIVAALSNNVNNSNVGNDKVVQKWSWNWGTDKTAQFYWFNVVVEPNELVEFSYEYYILGWSYELLSAGKGYRTLYGNPSNNNSLPNPAQMTVAEREEYGIETIARENLVNRATEINMSEMTLTGWLESNEDVFYYAHNIIEYDTPQSKKNELDKSTLTKDLLLEELSEQIERSERIIEGFSSDETKDMKDSIDIIEKHTVRLISLLEMQKQLTSTSEKNNFELNKMFDEYCRDIVDVDPAYSGKIKSQVSKC